MNLIKGKKYTLVVPEKVWDNLDNIKIALKIIEKLGPGTSYGEVVEATGIKSCFFNVADPVPSLWLSKLSISTYWRSAIERKLKSKFMYMVHNSYYFMTKYGCISFPTYQSHLRVSKKSVRRFSIMKGHIFPRAFINK